MTGTLAAPACVPARIRIQALVLRFDPIEGRLHIPVFGELWLLNGDEESV